MCLSYSVFEIDYLLVRMSVAECYLFMKFKTAQFLDVSDLIEMCPVIDIEGSFVLYKKLSIYVVLL